MVEKLDGEMKTMLTTAWNASTLKAITALSQTLSKKASISNVFVDILKLGEVPSILNPDNSYTGVVWGEISGVFNGVVVLSAEVKHILMLAEYLLHKPKGFFKDLSDENVSVIKEVTNIIAGYYIDSLNFFFDKGLVLGKVNLSVNSFKAVEFFGLGKTYDESNEVFVLENKFKIEGVVSKTFIITKSSVAKMFFERSLKKASFKI